MLHYEKLEVPRIVDLKDFRVSSGYTLALPSALDMKHPVDTRDPA